VRSWGGGMAIPLPPPLSLPAMPPAPLRSSNDSTVPGHSGFQLLEALIVLAVVGLIAALGMPALLRMSRRIRLRLAADEIATALESARMYAAAHSANVAVHFGKRGKKYVFSLYADGDGDGVHSEDIRTGKDPQIGFWRNLDHMGARIRFGIPTYLSPTDPSSPYRKLDRLQDPIRFNRSDLASFSGRGTATPGSVYLTDGLDLTVVRVLGRTGRIRILDYDRGAVSAG
jgi:type II secretory pathway pseudopilin PulG